MQITQTCNKTEMVEIYDYEYLERHHHLKRVPFLKWCEMQIKRIEKIKDRHPELAPSGKREECPNKCKKTGQVSSSLCVKCYGTGETFTRVFVDDPSFHTSHFKTDGKAVAEYRRKGR